MPETVSIIQNCFIFSINFFARRIITNQIVISGQSRKKKEARLSTPFKLLIIFLLHQPSPSTPATPINTFRIFQR